MLWAILLGLGVGLFYAVAPPPVAFGYDDEVLVIDQPRPRTASDLARAFTRPHYGGLPYYRPVVRVTYLAQKAVHGDRPAAFRLANAVLAALLLPLAYVLLRRPVFGIRAGPALLSAAVFALHPVA
ncbi:MAG: hypothetical protein R3344_01650, partial [Acidobacteriota bacterium]|nr:hypothetical protein [Acidobacteriota bacterium]